MDNTFFRTGKSFRTFGLMSESLRPFENQKKKILFISLLCNVFLFSSNQTIFNITMFIRLTHIQTRKLLSTMRKVLQIKFNCLIVCYLLKIPLQNRYIFTNRIIWNV